MNDHLPDDMENNLPDTEPKPWEGPFLIAGLGNPGRDYRRNRHNVGFMVIDQLSEYFKIPLGKVQSQAITGSGLAMDQKVLLVKPQTYMNLSGNAVNSLRKYYKIEIDHIMIIHDDIDIPLGTLRIRAQGGAGGQKGMSSIIERLGTNNFPRTRVGIGRPPGQMPTADYVLENFFTEENEILSLVFDRVISAMGVFIQAGIEPSMTRFNGALVKE
jgi:PTH1 family peptidyl-tRNA hydrolase